MRIANRCRLLVACYCRLSLTRILISYCTHVITHTHTTATVFLFYPSSSFLDYRSFELTDEQKAHIPILTHTDTILILILLVFSHNYRSFELTDEQKARVRAMSAKPLMKPEWRSDQTRYDLSKVPQPPIYHYYPALHFVTTL